MSRRAVGAVLCAGAAVALILAGVMPWWRSADPDGPVRRANITLLGGEACLHAQRVECKAVALAGRPGLRDDAFAWAARVTLVALMLAAAVAIALAFAGDRRRPWLRSVVAASAGLAAALAAATMAISDLPLLPGIPTAGRAVELALAGAAAMMAAAAWPTGAGGGRGGLALATTGLAAAQPSKAGRRFGLAGAVLALALLGWITLATRNWWIGATDFGTRTQSPLGIEVCDLGQCGQAGNIATPLGRWALLALAAMSSAVVLVVAVGLAVRVAHGASSRAWATATAISAAVALVVAGAALGMPVPRARIGVSAWLDLASLASLFGLALVAARGFADVVALGPSAGATTARPVLAPLGHGAGGPRVSPLPSAPPAITAYAPALSPAPTRLHAAVAPMAPRPSPYCPTCRGATLWHGKREAWWCSACKQTL